MSSNGASVAAAKRISALHYTDVSPEPTPQEVEASMDAITQATAEATREERGPSAEQIAHMVEHARREAAAAMAASLQSQCEQRVSEERKRVDASVEAFLSERREYFAAVERDVVDLALAIARKILHREAQLDPKLLAALVRLAIEQMNAGPAVKVRVCSANAASWTAHFAGGVQGRTVEVVADNSIAADDCVLETSLGSTSFNLDAQLKEVEQGLFDLLSRRPEGA